MKNPKRLQQHLPKRQSKQVEVDFDSGLWLIGSMSEKDDYFDYVSSVLGVRSIYVDSQAGLAAPKEVVPLLITVENLLHYSAEEKELLEKMISALKIDLNKIKVCEVSDAIRFESAYLLNFSDNPSETSAAENILTTYSPRVLVKNSALKKQVWNDLQNVIKYFSN